MNDAMMLDWGKCQVDSEWEEGYGVVHHQSAKLLCHYYSGVYVENDMV